MACWLNVHHPVPKGREEQECNTLNLGAPWGDRLGECAKGDLVFIYETGGPATVEVSDGRGRVTERLLRGRSGIIAVGKIKGQFVREEWDWNGKRYIGCFPLELVPAKFVALATIKEHLGSFQTRIPCGVRRLKEPECKLLRRLTGVGD